MSDSWHKHIKCPKCSSGIRQRLFIAALQFIDNLLIEALIHNKKILHFAPEDIISSVIQRNSKYYATTDFLREDCDFKLDMSNMPEINNESFDVVIAFDVLEHVPNYREALMEVYRILPPNGCAIFTVPQKDKLLVTYEDPTIETAKEREIRFGQWDHLRIFGDDFTKIVEDLGFSVQAIDESMFSNDIANKYVLFPPVLSKRPLATNYRKVFFCIKSG